MALVSSEDSSAVQQTVFADLRTVGVDYDQRYLSGPFCEDPPGSFGYLFDFIEFCVDQLKLESSVATAKILVVSVGSGNGYVEGHLRRKYPSLEYVGIDPQPNEWHAVPAENYDAVCLKAEYETVADFLESRADAATQKIILLMLWPEPNNPGYDLDALLSLKPDAFFITYGPCGCAGSQQLIDALDPENSMGAPEQLTFHSSQLTYRLKLLYRITIGTGSGFSGKTEHCIAYHSFRDLSPAHVHTKTRSQKRNECIVS